LPSRSLTIGLFQNGTLKAKCRPRSISYGKFRPFVTGALRGPRSRSMRAVATHNPTGISSVPAFSKNRRATRRQPNLFRLHSVLWLFSQEFANFGVCTCGTDRGGHSEPARRTKQKHINCGEPWRYCFARAFFASLTSASRNSPAVVTRCGKSSRTVFTPALRSMPSGSQPVQRQSAGSAPISLVA
jgi:hypothetical protein